MPRPREPDLAILAILTFCALSVTGNASHALAGTASGAQRTTGVLIAGQALRGRLVAECAALDGSRHD